MRLTSLLPATLALGLSMTRAFPAPHGHIIHEARASIPPGWSLMRRAEPNIVLPLRIALVQPNIARLEDYLMEVSHPESPAYGKHWSFTKLAQTFRPSDEAVDTVRSWLMGSGVSAERLKMSKDGSWVRADVTVEEAEELLRTEYHIYHHVDSDEETIACAERYHLPDHVAKHVELVTPTLQLGVKSRRRPIQKRGDLGSNTRWVNAPAFVPFTPTAKVDGPMTDDLSSALTACGQQLTPDCLQLLYNFTDYQPQVPGNNTIAIVEYTPNEYVASDMDMFFGNFSPSQVGERPVLVSIDGGVVQMVDKTLDNTVESNMDLQYTMALVGPTQNVTLFQAGDTVIGASPNDVLDALDASYCTYEGGDDPPLDPTYPDTQSSGYDGHDCGTVSLPNIMSTSYDSVEVDFTPSYMIRMCNEYGKLGLMGVTVLYATGDHGVAGTNGDCLNPDGTTSSNGTIFNPTFPAGCPYVTGVGATEISATSVDNPESAASQPGYVYSGGGFSNIFAIPSYQQSAVENYLTNYSPSYPAGTFNASGRAFPDLSANGVRYAVAALGEWLDVYGTSASTPAIAAFLSSVNDARIAAGKSTIGFINPTIYSSTMQVAFNDVTSGNNPGCGTNGFSAEPGWDPVTGLGTPNVGMLRELWLLLP